MNFPLEYQIKLVLTSRAAPKMSSIAMLIGRALVNAITFTGSSYMLSRLSKDSIDDERKRLDLAIEQLQKAQVECTQKRQERIDFINKLHRSE